jgi:hypothetical protein
MTLTKEGSDEVPKSDRLEKVDQKRRHFFRDVLSQGLSLVDEVRGKPQLLLEDIGRLPDESIRYMVPVLSESAHYRIERGWLLLKDKGVFVEFHRLDSQDLEILQAFDGRRTIEELAVFFHQRDGIDHWASYQRVKLLFVTLTRIAVCHPLHPHD